MAKMVKVFRLSTKDNPYDPFEKFDEWLSYDTLMHYHTPEILARFAKTSSDLSEDDYNSEIEHAIDTIVSKDPTQNFIKVSKEVPSPYEDYDKK